MTRHLVALVIFFSLSGCDGDIGKALATPILKFNINQLLDHKTVVEKSKVYLRSNEQVCIYKDYLKERNNKAFYVTDSAGYGWSADRVSKDVALEDALGYCQKSNKNRQCVLFDINGEIQVETLAINFDVDCCQYECSGNTGDKDQDKHSRDELEGMARLGSTYALFKIGKAYLYGTNGYEQDPAKAIARFTVAANKGDSYSMAWLGYIYDEGLGVEKDPAKAKEWYALAAKNGSDYAKEWLEQH